MAGILVLVPIAALAFGQASVDWHYKLAGLADPFLGRPAPELSVILGFVLSILVFIAVAVARRIGLASPEPATTTRARLRWHWWWLLITGWGGYLAGSAIVIAGGGPANYPTSMRVEFGSPLGSAVDVPATCRTVVGRPELVAEVVPAVGGFPQIVLRSVATGADSYRGLGPAQVILANDGVPGNNYEPPNVPDRPAPYIQMTAPDGSTQAQPPISFMQAYDYHAIRLEERGLTGQADLLGVRFSDPFNSAELKWMNLEMPHDPWPAAIDVTMSWSCGEAAGLTSPAPSSPAASASPAASSAIAGPVRARIRILTSVGWANVRLTGAHFAQPVLVDVQGEIDTANFDGEVFGLAQPGAGEEAGVTVEMTWEVLIEEVTSASTLAVEIWPGAIGTTTVILYNVLGDEPFAVRAVRWSGGTTTFREIARWPASVLVE